MAITARSVDGLQETLATIEDLGGTAVMFPCDLSDPNGGRDSLVARTEEALGPIDVLVNNAVAHTLKPVHEFTVPELESYAQCNLWAPWLHMSQVIPGMQARGEGWILNLTSFSAELPPGPPFALKAKDGSAMYGATKAALNRLTLAAAGENEGVIAVNALTPQVAILTPRVKAGNIVTLNDICEPVETMAESALALCTGDPAVLTGRIAYSLQLLLELERPTYDLAGKELVEGLAARGPAFDHQARHGVPYQERLARRLQFSSPSHPGAVLASLDGRLESLTARWVADRPERFLRIG